MPLDVSLAPAAVVLPLRDLHRREMNCQIVLDSWPGRGWVDPYLLRADDRTVGYGLVGGVRGDPKDTVVEFFVLPARRGAALCAVLIRILVDSDLYRRQLKGEPWQTGRRDQDYACLRDSLPCSSA